jgi:hypothetical protein
MQRVWFGIALTAFLGWTGWMTYVAITAADPIVVSRPQIYSSPIVVAAEVPAGEGTPREVTITHVYRGQKLLAVAETETQPKELKIVVSNLGEARGWVGPGEYILALERITLPEGVTYEVVTTPISPGFTPADGSEYLSPAIYPATPSARAQALEALRTAS